MLHHKLFPQLSLCEARKCQFINEIYRHFQPVKKPSLHIRSRLGFSTDWERHVIIFRSIACLRFLQPLPELLQRDNIPVAFLFLFSSLFTPGVELTVADAARLDPRKAPLVFSAVCLEYRVIGLFQRPLLECTDLPAFLLSLRHRPLAVLRADAPRLSKVAPQFLHRRTVMFCSTQRCREIFTFREFKSIHKGKTAILHLCFGTEKNRRLGSKKARYNRTFRRRHLFCLYILVRPTGFEPAAFRVGV